MYIKYDKSHLLFDRLAKQSNRIDKVKAIAIGMIDTSLTATTYYVTDLKNKMCAHFLVDSESVVKYIYSTTNVFDTSFAPIVWRKEAQALIENTKFKEKSPSITTSYLPVTALFLPKGSINRKGIKRNVKGITIHVATSTSSTALQERKHLENNKREVLEYSWHVCVDNANAIMAVPYDELAHHCDTGGLETVGILLCQNGTRATTLKRAAQLVANILQDYDLTIQKVYRHQTWTDTEDCAAHFFDEESWSQFLTLVETYLNPETVPVATYNQETDMVNVTTNSTQYYDPGNHILYVLVLNNLPQEQYYLIEDKLIRFLGDYLRTHCVTPDILCRLNDVLESPMTCFPEYYADPSDWQKFKACVAKYMSDVKTTPYAVTVMYTGVPLNHCDPDYTEDDALQIEANMED